MANVLVNGWFTP